MAASVLLLVAAIVTISIPGALAGLGLDVSSVSSSFAGWRLLSGTHHGEAVLNGMHWKEFWWQMVLLWCLNVGDCWFIKDEHTALSSDACC
jgi:hypothetical protein